MPVMRIRDVRMIVYEREVPMRVRVWLGKRYPGLVAVLMMRVVRV